MFSFFRKRRSQHAAVRYISGTGWLDLAASTLVRETAAAIAARIAWSESRGTLPIWGGYGGRGHPALGTERTARQVSTRRDVGAFLYGVVRSRRPDCIVEVGTAFGVSGMYWLAALEANKRGELITFDPNDAWTAIARENLAAIGTRFSAIRGTVEDRLGDAFEDGTIDIAFIDAIHTAEVIHAQFALLRPHMAAGGLMLLDDINFSTDMMQGWAELAAAREVRAATLADRVGVLQRT